MEREDIKLTVVTLLAAVLILGIVWTGYSYAQRRNQLQYEQEMREMDACNKQDIHEIYTSSEVGGANTDCARDTTSDFSDVPMDMDYDEYVEYKMQKERGLQSAQAAEEKKTD